MFKQWKDDENYCNDRTSGHKSWRVWTSIDRSKRVKTMCKLSRRKHWNGNCKFFYLRFEILDLTLEEQSFCEHFLTWPNIFLKATLAFYSTSTPPLRIQFNFIDLCFLFFCNWTYTTILSIDWFQKGLNRRTPQQKQTCHDKRIGIDSIYYNMYNSISKEQKNNKTCLYSSPFIILHKSIMCCQRDC